ncbi:MAG: hypothetical protein JRF56_20365 [Deltaproteobacteria bacterium]|jgi:hypothetical protein|nr:hypothetical protein [Deltaproteobacteria bacterium]
MKKALSHKIILILTIVTACNLIFLAHSMRAVTMKPTFNETTSAAIGDLRITVVYDNNPYKEGLTTSWGFACVVKGAGKTILNTPVLLILDENIENAMSRIKAGRIDCVMSKPLGSGEIQKVMQYFLGKRVMTYENYDRVRGTGSNSTGRAPIRHISLFDNYRHANHGI